jgi:hypothetical protein
MMFRHDQVKLTITVIMVHLRQHIDRVRIECEIRIVYDPKSVKLMT